MSLGFEVLNKVVECKIFLSWDLYSLGAQTMVDALNWFNQGDHVLFPTVLLPYSSSLTKELYFQVLHLNGT